MEPPPKSPNKTVPPTCSRCFWLAGKANRGVSEKVKVYGVLQVEHGPKRLELLDRKRGLAAFG